MSSSETIGRNRAPRQPNRTPLAYYRSAPPSKGSPFVKGARPRNRKIFSKAVDVLLLGLILAAIAYSLIVSPSPKLELNSDAYHSGSTYEQVASKLFKDFKNRNKLTLDEKNITASLQKQFPEISTATIDLPLFGQTPKLTLNIANPSFFLNSQGINYVVDSKGVAVGSSADLPQIKGLTTIIDQTGFSSQAGSPVLSAQSVNFINVVISQGQHAKVPIASLTLPPLAQELDLRTTDRSYFVKFYLSGDALVQAGQFLAARHQFDQTNNQPSQYLDVRVPGKIYYK